MRPFDVLPRFASSALCVPAALLPAALLLAACQAPLTPQFAVTAPKPASAPTAAPAPAAASSPASADRPAPADATITPVTADRDFPAYRLLRERRLMVPVLGRTILDVEDTFHHARSGDRVHRAVDIRAPRGTPVLAADDGVVLAVRSNTLGGLTVYCSDPAGRLVYYYAHLDRYADGLAAGQRIRQGDVLGTVGTTGNAPPDVPHLHFQVMELVDRRRYWDGPVLDPRPYFTLDGGQSAEGR